MDSTPSLSQRTLEPKNELPSVKSDGPSKRLTVTFRNIDVQVNGLGEDFAPTCLSVLEYLNPFGGRKASKRHIVQDVSGQVRPGEMLLVLGRPGSGCTSLLKILSNQREEFEAVEGDVHFGSLGSTEARELRNYIVMNTEEDLHFPTLTVEQTTNFATSTKRPCSRPEDLNISQKYTPHMTHCILSALGISHTKKTIVGNELIRGVSGGERKRVSIAEVMATQAPLQCWDNSTRGLDARNALEFSHVLRRSADEEGKTIIATLYQAGNAIYNLFDKILVLAEGKQIYYGPASEAKQYFEKMGFKCPSGANISDFLTSVAVHTERNVRPGFEGHVPNTTDELRQSYVKSDLYKRMIEDMNSTMNKSLRQEIADLSEVRNLQKNRSRYLLSRENSPYTMSFAHQVWTCSKRQIQIIWGGWQSNLLQICSSLVIALITGSLYFNLPTNSSSLFAKTGALCFPVLYFAMTRMSETTASFSGRQIISRQKRLAFCRPSAYALAWAVTDIPIIMVVFTIFQVIYYFMVGFQRKADNFFICYLFLLVLTLSYASMYRMIGAWCRHAGLAFQINGLITTVFLVYIGYMIPLRNIPVWFRWIAWMNPAVYAYNAIMANELADQQLKCIEPQLIPFGPSYTDNHYRGCSVIGSGNDAYIDGETFISVTYWASKKWVWINLAILIAFWVFFAFMTAVGFEVKLHRGSGQKIIFERKTLAKEAAKLNDIERAEASCEPWDVTTRSTENVTFTFKDINYFVHHEGKETQLLQGVSGFIKQGQLTAIMGTSGAGKTTLMDVLAQRKDSGRIGGSIMINGKPQGISFQRTTGYCEQNDIHEPTATVWESLLFSARLRQDYKVPDEAKQDYVRRVMNLLELTPLQHAIVGNPDSGLSIEQRKRLTLATELVAKPSLLFLDEPTSGLDGQSAFEICRFLRKLAAAGQTIICTIHQPSASLFDTFDVLLLLSRGGRTAYFGPTGRGSAQVIEYFTQRGAPCPPDTNPAEHIVDVVQSHLDVDWHQQWLESGEIVQLMQELDELNATARQNQPSIQPSAREGKKEVGFATPVLYQVLLVTRRQMVALWRNPDYVWNKIFLHITNGLFGGFTFWMLGSDKFDMQLHMMAIFNFVTVAPGCINQLQPLFIRNRHIFETREKNSKTYHWSAFVAAQILSEIPLLILCGTFVFVTWYFSVGFPVNASISGQVYLQMLLYEGLYTSIGQAIAACSPNEYFAALANPIIIGAVLINFSGVVVPYSQIPPFWRYWLYYLNPFTYLTQGLLQPVAWGLHIQCSQDELTHFEIPTSLTCGEYMADFLEANSGYLVNPNDTAACSYCPYTTGADYLKTINISGDYYGWRGIGITALFCISSHALVFLMMKIRTKATKKAR
ncbi:multidrug resistance protein CDR1 [Penicillium concentricum]|uniref:Multidrug resistance protein CDR1 n=1 Tax=Penicillium concentricum TaxID=293559 RepID=A0A9W9RTP3_9EURO|nr:multidrug resistance protein CDR1 [Penicillium concentricum]KAJ5365460.1 multidrug resistance protein CDR1 [Penicillium concentricum]